MRVLLRATATPRQALLLRSRTSRASHAALPRTRPRLATIATAAPATATTMPSLRYPADPRGAAHAPKVIADPFGPNAPADITAVIDELNERYNAFHLEYERLFWSTKMALPDPSSTAEALAAAKTNYETFLADRPSLERVQQLLARPDATDTQRRVLDVMRRTFETCVCPSADAAGIKEKLNTLEAALASKRNAMALGMTKKDNEFVPMSSVQLRNTMRVSDDEAERRAAYEGLRSIGPFVAADFCEIVKLRNALARAMSTEDRKYEDYYDLSVQQAENGMTKQQLFEILDDLERRTKPIMDAARARLATDKGAAALEPWNIGQALSGDITKEMDPYFPFENAVDVWARSFAALGLTYSGGEMVLDLCDREKKYSNGFCAWPQPAYRRARDGAFVPARANFTSLATPSAPGSGFTALTTLLHEGGHAAHFAAVDQPSPFCGNERPPFSVALAETQSMTLDRFGSAAGWLARYAVSRDGQTIPWSLIEKNIRATHPYEVFALRAMIAVSYFEKALFELPDEEVTPERVLALADEIEHKIQGGLSPRPLLSVPHILADESSAMYHGYVLAECGVHQNWKFFRAALGTHDLADRPEIGAWLTRGYFHAGNTRPFLPLVEELTGSPLSADAWVAELEASVEEVVEREKRDYEAALAAGGARYKSGDKAVEEALGNMRVILAHGAETIADSAADGGLKAATDKFAAWVRKQYF